MNSKEKFWKKLEYLEKIIKAKKEWKNDLVLEFVEKIINECYEEPKWYEDTIKWAVNK